jgi:hypothetical protein
MPPSVFGDAGVTVGGGVGGAGRAGEAAGGQLGGAEMLDADGASGVLLGVLLSADEVGDVGEVGTRGASEL